MRTLPLLFKGRASQSDFFFELIEREGNKAIYKKTDSYNNCYWETIMIKISKEANIGGNIIEAHEAYPSDNQFGTYAWCCKDYLTAKNYYDNITYTPNE